MAAYGIVNPKSKLPIKYSAAAEAANRVDSHRDSMSDPLATYVHDHLAGAMHAIEVLENLRSVYDGQSLGKFAEDILKEVEADRDTLKGLAEHVGAGASSIKELAAWVTEKASRIKLSHDPANSIGTFEALEFLTLGIHGKLALWRALNAMSPSDNRLQGLDYHELIERAESQHKRVEERRLLLAHAALQSSAR